MPSINNLELSRLFSGISETDYPRILSCLNARSASYKKGNFILRAGDEVKQVGIVLEGCVHVIKEEASGERSLLAQLHPGDHFAESLCCAGVSKSPVSVVCEMDSLVLLLDFRQILQTCSDACSFHTKLIENMLFVVASKNLQLQDRMEYLSQKTLRPRILKYLGNVSGASNQTFTIPLNREELADYLCADRSALSRELGKLKKENVIDYWKNQFKLL